MKQTFDIYNSDSIMMSSVQATKDIYGKLLVIIPGLIPETTYSNLSISYAGMPERADIPKFTTLKQSNLVGQAVVNESRVN